MFLKQLEILSYTRFFVQACVVRYVVHIDYFSLTLTIIEGTPNVSASEE